MSRRSVALPALAASLLLLSVTSVEAQVTPDQAAPFIGDWTATLQGGPQGPITMDISVADEGGTVVGSVTTAQGGEAAVEDFSMSESSLVLGYTVDFAGQGAAIEISLTPNAEMLDVALSLGGGAIPGGGAMPPITGTAERQ